jgi:hypothetical protein
MINNKKKYYRPLPDNVTITANEELTKSTGTNQLGLYATTNIEADTVLGISHINDPDFEDGMIRTPLGGFFNHSVKPNCRILPDAMRTGIFTLVTSKNINKGEELTCKYTTYDPTKI